MGKGWSLPSRDLPFARPMTPHGPFVLFDVDGTLLDGGVLITDIMIESFLAAGETPPSAADVRAAIGLSVPEMLLTLAPHLDQDRLDKILNGYRLRYFDMVESEEGPPVYPGASKALSVLNKQGLTLGLATGKSRRSLDHVLTAMR